MSGTRDKSPRRTGRPGSSRLLLGVLGLVVAVGALAFATIEAPSSPSPSSPSAKPATKERQTVPGTKAAQEITPPAFGHDIALPPPPEAPPPPTAAEIEGTTPSSGSARSAAGASPGPASLPIEVLRRQAEAHDLSSMVELSRRLILGIGIAKDPQAGAGWMLRAAELGSSDAAFNVGVMYENGFVVERDSSRAAQWYRRAAEKGLPAAEHNLALMLREGKGVARDGAEAVKLLLAAAHQGMTASMFALGDIYEQGDVAPKDAAAAVAWFALAAQFERRSHDGKETPLAKNATRRSQDLRRVMTPAELQRAQDLGQREIREIVEATSPQRRAPGHLPSPALPSPAPSTSLSDQEIGWPSDTHDQVRAIQQALADLKLLQDKPDGILGPMTRNAIRSFQRGVGLGETGEPSRDLYIALKRALTKP
ncbi:MAG TPA: SEL1-like repeat protein [Reyranella sp.]|nr:SEL1-like repeat protein [Reyranella sp.]